MKLKLLFFPIALIVSISLIIGFISPEFSLMGDKRKNLKSEEATLANVIEKKQNINSLSSDLNSNKNKEDLVKNYLPVSQSEEELINKVYKNIIDSKVSLINLGFSVDKAEAPSGNPIQQEMGRDESLLPISIKKVVFTAEVLGTYENLRNFFNNIYTMERFNNIDSINISKGSKGGDDKSPSSDNLTASVSMGFSYFSPVPVGNNYNLSAFSKKKFDFSTANELEVMITKRIPSVEVGATGKNNPFIP